MERHVQQYLQSSLSQSTMRSYSSGQRRYYNFCSRSGHNPFPTSEPVLCQFVSFLAIEQLKHKTIKSYLSSVRFLQILQCGTDPFIRDLPRLTYVLRGIKSEEAKKDNRARPRLPVTPLLLTRIYHILLRDPTNFDNIMIWAASLTCFFGFLRSGEITVPSLSGYDPAVHLNYNDISVDNPSNPAIIKVRIKASKTDPFRQGVNIYIGKTGYLLCPVSALLKYLAVCGSQEGLLFKFRNNSPLTKSKFVAKFRQLLQQAGFDSSLYSGHSFRIGAATTAAANGVEDSTIQTLGRWKSSAYLSYVRIPPENLAALSRSLCENNQ